MPPWELWLAFVAANTVLAIIPGPTVMQVVGYALTHGRRAAPSLVTGVTLGNVTALGLSFLGLGALLAASATLFAAFKWVGAAYLVYLGVQQWRAAPATDGGADTAVGPRRRHRALLAHCWLVTALNPKGIIFLVAYVPQFMTPHAPAVPQLAALGVTYLAVNALNAGGYALLAGTAQQVMHRPAVQRAAHRVSGGLLIGAGGMTAALHRTA